MIPLQSAASYTTDAAIRKKSYGSGMTTQVISNYEMKYIMKKVKSLEEKGLLTKSVSEKNQNEAREEKGGFLGMLIGILGASL